VAYPAVETAGPVSTLSTAERTDICGQQGGRDAFSGERFVRRALELEAEFMAVALRQVRMGINPHGLDLVAQLGQVDRVHREVNGETWCLSGALQLLNRDELP